MLVRSIVVPLPAFSVYVFLFRKFLATARGLSCRLKWVLLTDLVSLFAIIGLCA